MASFRRVHGRKLLLASIGVATATYIGCEEQTSGNLIAVPCEDTPAGCETSSSSSSSSGGGQAGSGGKGGEAGQAGAAGAGGQSGAGGSGGAGGGK